MVHMHSKQGLVGIVGPVNRGNRKGLSCSRISVKMAHTYDIGRQHFQMKTDVRET